ncbi:MAG: hypothetical protein A2328_06365, partial [Bdellovibrionales bacterium RIFOXYB2_FULL_36_6]
NTAKRVLAAAVLLVILLFIFFLGENAFIIFLILVGFLLIDETVINMFKYKRKSFGYFLNVFLYLLFINLSLYFCYPQYHSFYLSFINLESVDSILKPSHPLFYQFAWFVTMVHCLAIIYLFFVSINNLSIVYWLKKIKVFWGLYFFLNIALFILLIIFGKDQWKHLLALLFIICFGMDTGAWFFGRKFGKNKLWVSVSPNKTIEGVIGGVFLSGVLASLYYICFFEFKSPFIMVLFPFLGAISHLGDLFQSKMKRQCGVKNSSSLIPGHGGVYDRLDSVLFLTPFYLLVLFYYGVF